MSEQASTPSSPYKGLSSYDENDKRIFFGRDQEIETVASNLLSARLTVFYGASGVGKSSLLRAGVTPFVRDFPDTKALVFRRWQGTEFESALVSEILKDEEIADPGGMGFDQALEAIWKRGRRTITLMFDQFEEYLLYHSATEAAKFEGRLATVVNDPRHDVHILIAIREDSVAGLDRLKMRLPEIFSNVLRLEQLSRKAAEEAIRKPLIEFNKGRAEGDQATIDDELVTALLDQVKTGSVLLGSGGKGGVEKSSREGYVEAAYLQLALKRIWDVDAAKRPIKLALQTLTTLGGAAQIVRSHVDDVLKELTPAQQEMCVAIFDRLVTPSGAKIAYSIGNLAKYASTDDAAMQELLVKLASGENLILRAVPAPLGEDSGNRYEIYHDVLARPILAWREARVLEAQKAVFEKQRQEEYDKSRREYELEFERAKTRRFRVAAAIALLLAAFGVVSSITAYEQRDEARSQRVKADERAREAEEARKIAEAERRAAEDERRAAEQARQLAEEERQKAVEAANQAAAAGSFAAQTKRGQTTAPILEPPPPQTTDTIFLQVPSAEQRAGARMVADKLKAALPGLNIYSKATEIEIVPFYKGGNQLRYFRSDDKAEANKVFAALQPLVPGMKCVLVRGFDKVPPKQFEIWFSPASGANPDPAGASDTGATCS